MNAPSPSSTATEALVNELRYHERNFQSLIHGPLCGQAADEIERLGGAAQAAQQPYQKGYRDGYETAREDNKHREPDLVALYAFINAYGSQDSFTEGLDRAVKLARDAVAIYDFKKSEVVAVPSTQGKCTCGYIHGHAKDCPAHSSTQRETEA